ncbi:hypothetical protein [Roseateles chitinivorans]|uniref:hypothetical protein n=1 Tax=Roseateles chitinivorans TaxID=2917965 RepID=UPI003D670E07
MLMTLLFRSWSILAGAATVLVIPFFLSPVEQGYYYTFAGILGLHIFFELGLSQVVIQLVGHDVAHLRILGARLEGDEARIDRLASLVQLLRRWYVIAAALFALIGGLAGSAFFHFRGQLPVLEWAPVWIVLALSTAVNLAYMPALALMEGTGQIGHVARLRLLQSAIGYAGLWVVLFSGGRLWAAAVTPLVSAGMTAYWLRHQGGLYHWLRNKSFSAAHRIDWRKEVLPFQWRIAASWISGYFIFYAFTPLIFSHQGAAEAGRFGMAMTIFNSVSAVGMSWVNAKSPTFGMQISRGERRKLNALFLSVFKRSIAFTTLASMTVAVVAFSLANHGLHFMQRVAEPGIIASLAAVCIINCVIFSVATYMRAHREEPMLPVSVASGLATAFIAYVGSMHSVLLMSVGYLVMNLLLALPWSMHLFMRYFRRTT